MHFQHQKIHHGYTLKSVKFWKSKKKVQNFFRMIIFLRFHSAFMKFFHPIPVFWVELGNVGQKHVDSTVFWSKVWDNSQKSLQNNVLFGAKSGVKVHKYTSIHRCIVHFFQKSRWRCHYTKCIPPWCFISADNAWYSVKNFSKLIIFSTLTIFFQKAFISGKHDPTTQSWYNLPMPPSSKNT